MTNVNDLSDKLKSIKCTDNCIQKKGITVNYITKLLIRLNDFYKLISKTASDDV